MFRTFVRELSTCSLLNGCYLSPILQVHNRIRKWDRNYHLPPSILRICRLVRDKSESPYPFLETLTPPPLRMDGSRQSLTRKTRPSTAYSSKCLLFLYFLVRSISVYRHEKVQWWRNLLGETSTTVISIEKYISFTKETYLSINCLRSFKDLLSILITVSPCHYRKRDSTLRSHPSNIQFISSPRISLIPQVRVRIQRKHFVLRSSRKHPLLARLLTLILSSLTPFHVSCSFSYCPTKFQIEFNFHGGRRVTGFLHRLKNLCQGGTICKRF